MESRAWEKLEWSRGEVEITAEKRNSQARGKIRQVRAERRWESKRVIEARASAHQWMFIIATHKRADNVGR